MNRKLLISVLNYKNYQQTVTCVNQLLSLPTIESDSVDIVIVDNNSKNDSFELLSKYYKSSKVKVLKTNKNNGYSYGNNFSIKYQKNRGINYKYFCIINPDVKVNNDIFSPLLDDLENDKKIAIISTLIHSNGKMHVKGQSWRIPNSRDLWLDSFLLNNRNTYCSEYVVDNNGLLQTEVIPGSFFIIRESLFNKLGYLDENMFMYNEEIVLAIKIKKMGMKAIIDPRYYYEHNHPVYSKKEIFDHYRSNFGSILSMYRAGYTSRLYVCKRYYKSKGILMLRIVNKFNLLLLRVKHLLAYIY